MTVQNPFVIRLICFAAGISFFIWSVTSLYRYVQTAYFKQTATAEVIGYGRVGLGPVRPKVLFEFEGKKYQLYSMNFPLRMLKNRKPYSIGEKISIGFDYQNLSYVAIRNWMFWILYVLVLGMSFILMAIGIKGVPKKKTT